MSHKMSSGELKTRDPGGPSAVDNNVTMSRVIEKSRSTLDLGYHRPYSFRRRETQDAIVRGLLQHQHQRQHQHQHQQHQPPKPQQQWLVLTAGPIAVGKSTCIKYILASNKLPLANPVVIDLDEIRAALPRQDLLSKYRYGYETQREAGCIAEMAMLSALLLGRNVIFEGTLRNIEWHTMWLRELPSKLSQLRAELPLLPDLPDPSVCVLHMAAPLNVVRARVADRQRQAAAAAAAALAELKKALVPESKRQPRTGAGDPSPSYSRPTFSSANKRRGNGGIEKDRALMPRARARAKKGRNADAPVRIVPTRALVASFRVHHYSSLLPLCRRAKAPVSFSSCASPALDLTPALLLVSLDLSKPLPSIVYPWHYSWSDFTANFSTSSRSVAASPPVRSPETRGHISPPMTSTVASPGLEIDDCCERWYFGDIGSVASPRRDDKAGRAEAGGGDGSEMDDIACRGGYLKEVTRARTMIMATMATRGVLRSDYCTACSLDKLVCLRSHSSSRSSSRGESGSRSM